MRPLLTAISLMMMFATHASSEDENLFKGQSYGSFMFFEQVPNALFFEEDITNNDSFEFRKAIRNHNIDTIVLSSPGGALFEGLTIAGMIFDKGLTTYIPKTGRCASACAFMFFAGNNRQATGRLGVHQFYSTSDDESAKIANVEYGSQFTVSEIIGHLNEFETPPFVFERMFAQKQMYFFSDDELVKLNTASTDEATLANFSKIDKFIIKAKEATRQADAKAIEVKATEEMKVDDKLTLRKQIQAQLNRIGCTLGRADGKIGPASKRALSRFNRQNKSNYELTAFFEDKSQLNKLKKINSGFCSPILVQETETWNGYVICLSWMGRLPRSIKIIHVDEDNFKIVFPGAMCGYGPAEISFKKSNANESSKYTFGIKPITVTMDIDFDRSVASGTIKQHSLIESTVSLLLLDNPNGHFYFSK